MDSSDMARLAKDELAMDELGSPLGTFDASCDPVYRIVVDKMWKEARDQMETSVIAKVRDKVSSSVWNQMHIGSQVYAELASEVSEVDE
jgi:hypothetical protein